MFNKGLDKDEKQEGLLKRLKDIEHKTDNQLKAIEGQNNNQLRSIGYPIKDKIPKKQLKLIIFWLKKIVLLLSKAW